jgi:hypothetical protein
VLTQLLSQLQSLRDKKEHCEGKWMLFAKSRGSLRSRAVRNASSKTNPVMGRVTKGAKMISYLNCRTNSSYSPTKRNRNKFARSGAHPGLAEKASKAFANVAPAALQKGSQASKTKVRAKFNVVARAPTTCQPHSLTATSPSLPTFSVTCWARIYNTRFQKEDYRCGLAKHRGLRRGRSPQATSTAQTTHRCQHSESQRRAIGARLHPRAQRRRQGSGQCH